MDALDEQIRALYRKRMSIEKISEWFGMSVAHVRIVLGIRPEIEDAKVEAKEVVRKSKEEAEKILAEAKAVSEKKLGEIEEKIARYEAKLKERTSKFEDKESRLETVRQEAARKEIEQQEAKRQESLRKDESRLETTRLETTARIEIARIEATARLEANTKASQMVDVEVLEDKDKELEQEIARLREEALENANRLRELEEGVTEAKELEKRVIESADDERLALQVLRKIALNDKAPAQSRVIAATTLLDEKKGRRDAIAAADKLIGTANLNEALRSMRARRDEAYGTLNREINVTNK